MSTDQDLAPAPKTIRTGGMTARQAAAVQGVIIALCVLAMLLVFQPFSLWLYGLGAGLVIFGGLAFNLVPLCRPGTPARSLAKAGVIVVVLLLIVVGLAIASAWLYGLYLQRGQ